MSVRLTVMLWIAALAALAGAWSLLRREPSIRVDGLRALLDETTLPIERVNSIRLEKTASTEMTSAPSQPPWLFERVGDAWTEIIPSGLAADPFLLREVIESARRLQVSRVISADELRRAPDLLSRIGLDPPQATVRFEWDGGACVLLLGRRGVAGRAFLARGAEDSATPSRGVTPAERIFEVLVVDADLHAALLESDPRGWRQRTLFPEAGAGTGRVAFESESTSLEVVQRDGRWWIEAPVRTRADRAAVEAYLQAIARSDCEGFVDDAPSAESFVAQRLEPPTARLTVTSRRPGPAGNEDRVLRLGATLGPASSDRSALLEGHPVLLRLSGATVATLFPNPAMLVDPTATGLAAADIRVITITGPDGDFTLRRSLEEWVSIVSAGASVPEQPARRVESRLVDELLRRLTVVRAGSVALRGLPPELIVGSIRLEGFDGELLAELTVGSDASRQQWAIDAGDGVARLFPASTAPSLSPRDYGLPQPSQGR